MPLSRCVGDALARTRVSPWVRGGIRLSTFAAKALSESLRPPMVGNGGALISQFDAALSRLICLQNPTSGKFGEISAIAAWSSGLNVNSVVTTGTLAGSISPDWILQ